MSRHFTNPRALVMAAFLCLAAWSSFWGQTIQSSMPSPTPNNPLVTIALKTPVVSLAVARAALGLDTKGVMTLIDAGKLRWTFNLAMELGAHRTPRILSLSLADYQRGTRTAIPGDGNEFGAVMRLIFPMVPATRPGVVPTLRASTVARRLSVKSDHVLALADAGWFDLVKTSRRSCGPSGSPQIQFPSLAAFLKMRRLA